MANTIKITDLRLNNLLLYKDDIVRVTSLSLDEIRVVPVNLNVLTLVVSEQDLVTDLAGLEITDEWLLRFGFEGSVWKNIRLNEYQKLSIGRTDNESGLPRHLIIDEFNHQGITIRDAAEIQRRNNMANDEAFILKRNKVILRRANYVHEVQNLLFTLVGKDINL